MSVPQRKSRKSSDTNSRKNSQGDSRSRKNSGDTPKNSRMRSSRLEKMPSLGNFLNDDRHTTAQKFKRLAGSRGTSTGQSAFSVALTGCISRGREKEAIEMLQAVPEEDRVDAVNEIDRNGSAAIHHVSWHDRQSVCLELLKMRADPNLNNIRRNTGLHFACERGNRRLCSILVTHGADLRTANIDGQTPLDRIADPKVREKEGERLFKLQETWKDRMLSEMLKTQLSFADHHEIKQLWDFIDEETDGKMDGAINVQTVQKYLGLDDGKSPVLDLSVDEVNEFYQHLVGNTEEYLRFPAFLRSVLAMRAMEYEDELKQSESLAKQLDQIASSANKNDDDATTAAAAASS